MLKLSLNPVLQVELEPTLKPKLNPYLAEWGVIHDLLEAHFGFIWGWRWAFNTLSTKRKYMTTMISGSVVCQQMWAI